MWQRTISTCHSTNVINVGAYRSQHFRPSAPHKLATDCSWRRYPKAWLLALIAALGLLLTVILCALLVGCHHPKFTAGPDVIGRAGFSFDTSLAVDGSGYVYYTVVPSQNFFADLNPG